MMDHCAGLGQQPLASENAWHSLTSASLDVSVNKPGQQSDEANEKGQQQSDEAKDGEGCQLKINPLFRRVLDLDRSTEKRRREDAVLRRDHQLQQHAAEMDAKLEQVFAAREDRRRRAREWKKRVEESTSRWYSAQLRRQIRQMVESGEWDDDDVHSVMDPYDMAYKDDDVEAGHNDDEDNDKESSVETGGGKQKIKHDEAEEVQEKAMARRCPEKLAIKRWDKSIQRVNSAMKEETKRMEHRDGMIWNQD
jgi:hypothetical protein